MAKIAAFETRVTKLCKGEVYVEYKRGRWTEWIMHPKKFKSIPQANEWVIANVVKS